MGTAFAGLTNTERRERQFMRFRDAGMAVESAARRARISRRTAYYILARAREAMRAAG